MKFTTCYCVPVALFAFVFGSCSPSAQDDPAPKAQTTTSISVYSQYNTPEPMVEVAASLQRVNPNNTSETANDLITLGRTQVQGGQKLYYFYQSFCLCGGPYTYGPYNFGRWSAVNGPKGGGAVKIAISARTLYAVTNQNELWTAPMPSGINPTLTWTQLPVQAVDVAAYGPYVYFLGTATGYGGHPIYRFANGVATEVVPGGMAASLAVDNTGRPWVVSSVNEIFVGPAPGTSGGYEYVQGLGTDIACNGTTLGLLGINVNEIYSRYAFAPTSYYGWVWNGGQAAQITAATGEYGDFFVVTTSGDLFKVKL
jgi:hypothetical protein